jgi:hypothetical protein
MGRSRWTRRRRSPASSPKRKPVPSRVTMWSHQNSGKQASSRPASSGVRARRLTSPKTCSGSTRRLGGGTLRTGLVSIAPSSMANWKIRSANDRQWATVDGPTFRARCACQRRTSAGVILSIGRSANQGRTCSRSQLSALASVVGLGSSAAHVSHHSAAQALNDSRPRWRPRQVPRRISRRFSAARSRASSGVSTVLPPWEPSSSRQETR